MSDEEEEDEAIGDPEDEGYMLSPEEWRNAITKKSLRIKLRPQYRCKINGCSLPYNFERYMDLKDHIKENHTIEELIELAIKYETKMWGPVFEEET